MPAAYELNPEVSLGQANEGPDKVSIPGNALLSSLQLGKGEKKGPRWLNVGYRTIKGERRLELGEEAMLPATVAPDSNGGSAPIHVPDGCIVSAFQLGGGSLSIWYKRIVSPVDFTLSPERPGLGTKEPNDNGDGNKAFIDGFTLTGFQWMKDRDGTLALNIWYRQVP
jgi:hypothetical protein